MKQWLFHILMVCLFLPLLAVIAISLNNFGFPLMEQYQDRSIKFFIAFPYLLLIATALCGSVWVAGRLSGLLAVKFGGPDENKDENQAEDFEKLLDPKLIEKNRSIFMKNVDTWLKDNILARIILGLIIGFVIVM